MSLPSSPASAPNHPLSLFAQRQIRVFVSSTFRDMHAEREELMKRIFPQLRKLCESRSVTWTDVDLRWGVTDEQKAEGEALPICLAEIERCRPFFIGLLGERYGPSVEMIAPHLLAAEPWLAAHLDQSLTALEILHGVLRNPAMAGHAYFYFRDPVYLEHLPAGIDAADFRSQTPEQAERLRQLKDRIRTAGFPVHEDYANPAALGALVLADFTNVVNRLYPEDQQPSPLDREAMDQEAFAASRARVYIRRQNYFDQLDAHAAGDGPPLVVVGHSGAGKSALLANWAWEYRARHAQDLLLMHFIGATPASTDWSAMLRRILGEFDRRLGVKVEIPDSAEALRTAFANALYQAAVRSRVVLVLDALNQLEDRDGAPDLVWLPPELPPNVRLVVSTLPGRPLDDTNRRRWPQLTVEPLDPAERSQLIRDYLAQYTKVLASAQVDRIAAVHETANPLYLRAVLEELRVFGEHSRLAERIDYYLSARDIPELYERILARYEEDYDRERPNLVRDSLSLIWAARRGLSETELLYFLGSDGAPLAQVLWSPLFLAAEQALTNRGGLIGFAHQYVRDAVGTRYLASPEERKSRHMQLAWSFADEKFQSRINDEVPWHFAAAGEWIVLAKFLSSPEFFQPTWNTNQYDVKTYWAQIEANSDNRIEQWYQPVRDQATTDPVYAWSVSILLDEMGHPEDSLAIRSRLTDYYRAEGDRENLQASLGGQALILQNRGDLDAAMALSQEQERICREIGNQEGLQNSLGGQAAILEVRGDLNDAMTLYREQEEICRKLGNERARQASFAGQAYIHRLRGDLEAALALYREQERWYRSIGDREELQSVLGNQAAILLSQGDLDGSMALLKERELACRALGDQSHLAGCLVNMALILRTRGDLHNALLRLQEGEGIYRKIEARLSLALCLGHHGNTLGELGDLDGAMAKHKEAEDICRTIGNPEVLESTLGNESLVLSSRGDFEGSLVLLKEQERICRSLGKQDDLATCLGNQALILRKRGDLDGGMVLLKEAERICRSIGDQDRLQLNLSNQAAFLYDRKDFDGSLALLREQESICRRMGNQQGLLNNLGQQALWLAEKGDLDGAWTLLKEQESGYRAMGYQHGLQSNLANQAKVLSQRGKIEAALALFKEQERICRAIGEPQDLAICLENQAMLLATHGNVEAALPLCRERVKICHTLGDKEELKRSLGELRRNLLVQASSLEARLDFNGALTLYRELEATCRDFGDTFRDDDALQRSLGRQGMIQLRSDAESAEALFKEQEKICRAIGNQEDLQSSLGNQGIILYSRGDIDGALVLFKEQERICRLNHYGDLQLNLANQALIQRNLGNLDASLGLRREQEQVCRQLGNQQGLGESLIEQAQILHGRGQDEEAWKLLSEDEGIRRALGDKDGLQTNLGWQAGVLLVHGELDHAMARLKEEEQICRVIGNQKGLATSLGNQGIILAARGDPDGAMALHKEEERICRAIGEQSGLLRSLGNQANIQMDVGNLEGAKAALKEEESLCRALGYGPSLVANLGKQSRVAVRLGKVNEAVALVDQAYQVATALGSPGLIEHVQSLRNAALQSAQQLDVQYLRDLASWKALPWYRRARIRRPDRPS